MSTSSSPPPPASSPSPAAAPPDPSSPIPTSPPPASPSPPPPPPFPILSLRPPRSLPARPPLLLIRLRIRLLQLMTGMVHICRNKTMLHLYKIMVSKCLLDLLLLYQQFVCFLHTHLVLFRLHL
ncbi:acrosin-like [Zingiber officinale]|uniref:acrosin-like n=1 Tax=Zingiber officinale TaxID=94328 RepID=UPI001C4B134D|nr:acrosin-like [Zingiber officinale]